MTPDELTTETTKQPPQWHPGLVGLPFRLAELLLVIVPLVGVTIAAIKAISATPRRPDGPSHDAIEVAETRAGSTGNQAAQWRSITRVLEEHSRGDARWLDYELNVAKLLDFPPMTNMRNPLTMRFHRTKLRADLLRAWTTAVPAVC